MTKIRSSGSGFSRNSSCRRMEAPSSAILTTRIPKRSTGTVERRFARLSRTDRLLGTSPTAKKKPTREGADFSYISPNHQDPRLGNPQSLVEDHVRSPRAVGIPFCDEQGRYADFHSLRYSWATYLQRQGVNSRMAMELMRHSDRKLTDKIYTDVNLLPLGETVRNLPAEEDLTHILTNISGKTCLNGSRIVATDQSSETTETSVTVGDRRRLSQSDNYVCLFLTN
jgi:hypothetical protein